MDFCIIIVLLTVVFPNFLHIPLSSYATSLLLGIVMDYSSLVRCILKLAAKNIWPDFIKEITVEHRDKWQEK